MAPASDERKAANALEKYLNTFTFKAYHFAYIFSGTDVRVQRKLLEMFIAMISVWARVHDDELDWNTADPDTINLYTDAKLIREYLTRLGYSDHTHV